jgi:hypothetical protein
MNRNRLIRCLIFGILMFSLSAASFAQIAVGVSVRFGPPAIPVYAQPICPGSGYFWTPGYWSWNDDVGYYWVPGTWVIAPLGMLWTPGYWGWYGGFYRWHPGYWGPHVGFYGGINYGYGYTGFGFYGGEWRGDRFFYNRSVTNINVVNVTNVYNRTVIINNNSRVSYNGGSGGINARPTREEERFEREPHREALTDQVRHERSASQNRLLFASENHGRPAIAATGRPGEFSGRDVVRSRAAGAPYHPPKISPQEARGPAGGNRGSESRVDSRNRANDREVARPGNRNEGNRDVSRNNSRQEAQQQKADQRRAEQQAKPEQKRQQQQQQQQTQRAERTQAPQAQQQKADQRRAEQQAKPEQKHQQQRQQQQAQRAERTQAPQAQQQKADQRRGRTASQAGTETPAATATAAGPETPEQASEGGSEATLTGTKTSRPNFDRPQRFRSGSARGRTGHQMHRGVKSRAERQRRVAQPHNLKYAG